MSTAKKDDLESGSLSPSVHRLSMQPLGLSGLAESVYRTLLRHPGSATAELSHLVTGTYEGLTNALQFLNDRGLVRQTDTTPARWVAAAPEVAIELLLMERQAELNEARRILPELRKELVRGAAEVGTEEVHILPDAESQLEAYLELHDRARNSIWTFMRPPFLVSAPSALQSSRDAARKRGVRFKTILSPEVMKWDGWLAAVTQSAALGDEVRALDGLPFKMVVVDREWAMVPLRAEEPEGPALRVGSTSVVHSMSMMFERLWGEAVQVVDGRDDRSEFDGVNEAALEALATLLATGANDKTAAYVLGISDRTLQRRTAALSDHLHAKSRFQCGWLAARRFAR